MTLGETIQNAIGWLKSGLLENEAQVLDSVILPILEALGWGPDPTKRRKEFQVENRWVDVALFDSAAKPLVFIEAKRQGNLSPKAEEKLFSYATNKGIPILVLTDGDNWDLYLSLEAGEPPERRFAHLELIDSPDIDVVGRDLDRFLAHGAVVSGKAKSNAEVRLKQVLDRKKGKSGLAAAWVHLLEEPDEILRDLLIERVEAEVGSRPDLEDAEEFLSRQVPSLSVPRLQPEPPPSAPSSTNSTRSPNGKKKQKFIVGFELKGKHYSAKHGKEALLILAATLQQLDESFLRDLVEQEARKNLKVPAAVTSDNEVLKLGHDYRRVEPHPKYFIHVWGDNKQKKRRMELMVKIAGLDPEKDFKANVIEK